MKIAIAVTIDVKRDEWSDEYQGDASRDAIRADVVQYVTTALQAIFGLDGSDGVTPGVRSVSVRSGGRGSQ